MGVNHTFVMAYICVYFACMEHTFIVVLMECFVELIFLLKKALYGLNIAVYKSHWGSSISVQRVEI